jgi:hypothetical protein
MMIPVSAHNIEFVGHTDQNGRGDGVQVMVHKGHAFVGHMFSDGFTITDISDPPPIPPLRTRLLRPVAVLRGRAPVTISASRSRYSS